MITINRMLEGFIDRWLIWERRRDTRRRAQWKLHMVRDPQSGVWSRDPRFGIW